MTRLRQGTVREQQFAFAKMHLEKAPASPPGTKFEYSNAGYTIAGVMLEELTDTAYEDLLRQRLFEPLGMTSAGFGAPATDPKVIDQPWGHAAGPISPGWQADNPPALTSAGRVHCSLPDLGKYLQAILRGYHGDESLLKQDSWTVLRTPFSDPSYALGWGIVEREWANGFVMTHSGSNTMNFCFIWIAPEDKFAVVAVTNTGKPDAARSLDTLIAQMVRRFKSGSTPPATDDSVAQAERPVPASSPCAPIDGCCPQATYEFKSPRIGRAHRSRDWRPKLRRCSKCFRTPRR